MRSIRRRSTGSKAWSPMSAISAARPSTRSSSIPARWCARRWPIPRESTGTPIAPASAWWPGSRPTIAWCWSNERAAHFRAAGALCRHRTIPLDGAVLPRAVRIRAEDQLVADRDRATALSARVRFRRRMGGDQGGLRSALAGQFQAAGLGQSLHQLLPAQPRRRGDLDIDPAVDRLPDRLRHGAAAATLAGNCDDAGNHSVLDLVPDPHLCLDQYFAA